MLFVGYGGGLQQGGGGQQTLQEFPGGGYITTDSMGRLTSTNLGMCQGSGNQHVLRMRVCPNLRPPVGWQPNFTLAGCRCLAALMISDFICVLASGPSAYPQHLLSSRRSGCCRK